MNSFQYTARESDAETGLYYYRARYYDPNTGRFLNEDPLEFGAGVNFYAYVENNPVNWTDSLGLQPAVASTPSAAQPVRPGPTLVPKSVQPPFGQVVLDWLGDIGGAFAMILASPQSLNDGENDWLRKRDADIARDTCDRGPMLFGTLFPAG